MAKIYQKEQPAPVDRVTLGVQKALSSGIGWLDSIFGVCTTVKRSRRDGGSRKIRVAVWPKGDGDYIEIVPDDQRHGNTAFFLLDDPADEQFEGRWSRTFNLFVWGDLRKVMDGGYNSEWAADQLLHVLSGTTTREGSITLDKVYMRPENFTRGFDLEETDDQYLVHPFFGIRITGKIYYDETC